MSTTRTFGWLLLTAGALLAIYSLAVFDPSVASPGGMRVNNLGLLQDKQNMLIAGSVVVVIGVLMVLLGQQSNGPSQRTAASTNDPVQQLRAAIRDNDMPCVLALLSTGKVSPGSVESGKASSLLSYAAQLERLQAVELLLRYGADPTAVDGTGLSPLQAMVNRTPPKGTQARAILDLMRKPPALEQPVASQAPVANEAAADQGLSPAGAALMHHLERLAQMRTTGLLSPEEYTAAKAKLLAN